MGDRGTATVSFGAWPGASSVKVSVAAPTILAGSAVEAWVFPAVGGTADHSVDEHLAEQLKVIAYDVTAGVGFSIYAEVINGTGTGDYRVGWVWV